MENLLKRKCERLLIGRQIDKSFNDCCDEVATSYQYSEPKLHLKRKKKGVFALCEKCFDEFFLKRKDWYRAEISVCWYDSHKSYRYSNRNFGINLSNIEAINFYLSKSEDKNKKNWIRSHNKICPVETHPYNVRHKFYTTFITGDMGDICLLTCQCGEEKDITDYSEW